MHQGDIYLINLDPVFKTEKRFIKKLGSVERHFWSKLAQLPKN